MQDFIVLDAGSDRARLVAAQSGRQQVIIDQGPRALVCRDTRPRALVRQENRQVVLRESADPVPVIRESSPPKLLVNGVPGPRGPIGPAGPAGANGTDYFEFTQSVPATEWVIPHGLNRFPSVTVFDSASDQVFGRIEYDSVNQVKLTFSAPFAGSAYLI